MALTVLLRNKTFLPGALPEAPLSLLIWDPLTIPVKSWLRDILNWLDYGADKPLEGSIIEF